MAYWLFKSEPSDWSWEDQVAKGDVGEEWDGVRNYQARNNMRLMKVGDRGFFYHSQTDKAIVGVIEIIAEAHQDSTTDDDRWDCVDIKAIEPFATPISLGQIKSDERFAEMPLVKNTRLSVQPVEAVHWRQICRLGGVSH